MKKLLYLFPKFQISPLLASQDPAYETKSLFGADKRLLFVLLCVATLLLLYIKKSFIENQTAAFEFLQDRPEGMVLNTLSLVQFLTIPFVYFWKFTVIAFVIWVGCFLYGYRVSYRRCWGIVIAAEFIFIVPEVLKICWFMFFVKDPSLGDIRAFYPFSLILFFDYYAIDPRYGYPLRALNIFEVFYWFLLAGGIHYYVRKEKRIVWYIVASSYILIFFLWLIFYMIVYKQVQV